MDPLQRQRSGSTPVRAKKGTNGPASVTKAFLQPAKTATMCTACHDYAHSPPPIPPFLLAQSLSSKRTFPIDNMQSCMMRTFWHFFIFPICHSHLTILHLSVSSYHSPSFILIFLFYLYAMHACMWKWVKQLVLSVSSEISEFTE